MKFIKIYGLQRSGTNYMKALIEENFDARVLQNIGGWKHGMIDKNFHSTGFKSDFNSNQVQSLEQDLRDGKIPLIHVYKNPFAWIYDYREYKKDKKSIISLIKEYNEKNLHWISNCNLSVDYIDLLSNYQCSVILKIINAYLGGEMITNDKNLITDILAVMGRGDDHSWKKYAKKNQVFDKSFYLDKAYMKYFSEEEINQINELNIFYKW